MENHAPEDSGLEAEHGLSLFIETPESVFVFDCGQTGMAWRNALRLGIDLTQIRNVVLSHSHYDHAGGFPSLLKYVKPETIYIGPDFWQEKYSRDSETGKDIYKGCGFTKDDLADWGIEAVECSSLWKLDSCATLFTGFERHYPFEQIPKKFLRGGEKAADPFEDEICLLLKEGDGLALIVGCSHKGILNITSTVMERTGLPVRRILGGIHLNGAGQEQIKKTLQELQRLGVQELNLCHCSGIEQPGQIAAGSVIEINP